MKIRISIAVCFILFALVFCSKAATVVIKVSDFPNTATLDNTDLFLVADPGVTNMNINFAQLRAAIGTNGASVYYITNLFVGTEIVTNLYVTNAYFQDFHGKTTFIENSYITNLFVGTEVVTNLYVTNAYITNLTANFFTNNISYITNLYSSNAFITNLYVLSTTTNYFLFSTNIYQSYPTYVNNSYVSNYFQTNVFQNTYMSNFFNTNLFLYYTNIYQYSTNLTVTNFYAGDTFVSNFFNTNVFVNDNTVSNFFTTNIYNTVNITSNYFFQIFENRTNVTLYGTTTFAPVAGAHPGYISVLNGVNETIGLNGTNGTVQATRLIVTNGITLKTNTWIGPTNEVNVSFQEWYYVAYTPCAITNYLLTSGYADHALLTITNASSSNITFRLPSGTVIPVTDTHPYTVTNGDVAHISIGFKQNTPSVVVRQFHKLP